MNLYDVYPLFDVNIVKGEGCKVWDDKGNEYLDLYGGHAVISIGHAHPKYVEMISGQVATLGFYSNSVINTLQQRVACKLGKLSGYEDYNLFFINSGAEANENALKLSSFKNGKKRVIAFKKAFHGRTSLAVEVTDNPKIVAPVNSNGHTTFVAMGDIDAVRAEIERGDVTAVIIEGIQGVGGVQIPSATFLQQLQQLCNETDTTLILDEIQSGCGRSGKFFAHQWAGIKPDMITQAKGIGNGFPVGVVLISPKYQAVYGELGTTFGGNHLACAAVEAVLDVMESDNLLDNVNAVGGYLLNELRTIDGIKEVRGQGLMIGIEFDEPVKEIRRKLLFEERVFTGVSGTNTIRLLPPLTLTMEQAVLFIDKFKKVLTGN
ncbi:MAG: aminotransferase class III-fold pyridoxal phosphate-dependent enzyme [Bacteroidaceae bacterium]|nr:aminotransferase class III-fold pyridoxal phosphate-dependent enzyme [Bacteroidaceae bacterium]